MRERAAEECDRIWQENKLAHAELGSSYHEGAADAAYQCKITILALPLEGEPQGEPAEDQRGAGELPASTVSTASVNPPTGGCLGSEASDVQQPAQSAPHHHLPESVWKWKNEVQRCYPLANHEFMQGYLPQGGHIVWIDGRRERRDGALALSNTNSVENAWEDAAKEVQRRVSTGLVILEKQSEPAPAREPSAQLLLKCRFWDQWTPDECKQIAGEYTKQVEELDRLRALNRKLAKDVIALATENDRLRAENAELRAECAIRNDEVSGLIGMNADLRREREGMVPVSKKLMDSTISTLQEHGEHAIALNLWAALIAAKDKP